RPPISSLHCYRAPQHLHPFPTRRSSDLPILSRSPLSSPFGAGAPERCSPGRGSARVSFCPWREKPVFPTVTQVQPVPSAQPWQRDRKSTRLNSSHLGISYAVFCSKKKNDNTDLLLLKVVLAELGSAFAVTTDKLVR